MKKILKNRPRKKKFSKQNLVPAVAPKQTFFSLMQDFLGEFPKESGFERSINSSPALRSLLLRTLSVMSPETKNDVLRIILFGDDERHAHQAAKYLAVVRETWSSELLDAALQDTHPHTRRAALRGSVCRNPSYLVPRLRRAAADENESIRSYAQKVLQSYPGEAAAYDASVRCETCGNKIDPAVMDQHQARHKAKQPASPNIKVRVIDEHAGKPDPVYERGKPDYWEWDMTTFNTPKYRRR